MFGFGGYRGTFEGLFEEVKEIVDKLDLDSVRGVLSELADLKDRQVGSLFLEWVVAQEMPHAVMTFENYAVLRHMPQRITYRATARN